MREDALLDQMSALENAEQKGLEKGIEQGLKQGRYKRDIEIAVNLIKRGLDDEFIQATTNLNLDVIKELRSGELNKL